MKGGCGQFWCVNILAFHGVALHDCIDDDRGLFAPGWNGKFDSPNKESNGIAPHH